MDRKPEYGAHAMTRSITLPLRGSHRRRIASRALVLLTGAAFACGTNVEPSPSLAGDGSAASRPTSRAAARPVAEDLHRPFDILLRKHVTEQRVDYLTWRDDADDRTALASYLEALAVAEIDEWPEADRLAFYINLYNATMIHTILDRVDATYSTSDAEFGVFKEPLVALGGDQKVTLDHLEHGLVRKQFKEPRIHVALVCGARSCPPLIARAYRGDDLDRTLEANMRAFVNSGERNVIGDEGMELSKIFEWFADDFGGAAAVPNYVDRYVDGRDVSKLPVEFLEYSWVLNIAAPSGTWKRVTRALPGLDEDALVEVLSVEGDKTTVRKPGGAGELVVATGALADYEF